MLLSKYSSINQNVEKESGCGVIKLIAMMTFQEIGDGTEGEAEVLPYYFYPKNAIKVAISITMIYSLKRFMTKSSISFKKRRNICLLKYNKSYQALIITIYFSK